MAFTSSWLANIDPSMQNTSAYFTSMSPEQHTMLFAQFQMIPPSPPPSIQPDLEVASALHEVRGALAEIKNNVDNLKWKWDNIGDNDIDVDNADDKQEKSVHHWRANQARHSCRTTYKKGTHNMGRAPACQKYVKFLTKTLMKASESDSDLDSDDSDDDTGTNQMAPKEKFSFDFQMDVNVAPNDSIIHIQLGFYLYIHFMKKDVEAFAKANYHYLCQIYLMETSEAKSIKCARQIRKNKWLAILAEYQAQYEIDLMPLLMDPSLMSEEVSELSKNDEGREEHKKRVQGG
ncbi:hypothetical protein BDR05DRAFT_953071 [Suillus weaverae]|nr:hypothetical protein BDR05DRAFT_953071 [Suillus weaverae]